MGNKAARMGDMTAHTSSLTGTGHPTTQIEGSAAWRVGDVHTCSMQNCPPPPAPPVPSIPHLVGSVLKGSFTVLIGSQPAARQGDICFEPAACPPTIPPPPVAATWKGPLNEINRGASNTEIGDFAFGILVRAVLEQFCRDWTQLRADWPTLTPAERSARTKEICDRALQSTGSPPTSAITETADPGALASFSGSSFELNMPPGFSAGGVPDRSVGATLIHEMRHGEQFFNEARMLAGQGMNAGQIQAATGASAAVAAAAEASPAAADTAAGQHGQMMNNQTVGPDRPTNDAVRNELDRAAATGDRAQHSAAYDAYFGLPEEADSRAAEDALKALCPEAG